MRNNRELYFKKIGELTQKEFEKLFNISTDISDANFRKSIEPIARYSVADINTTDYNKDDMNFTTAYLLGCIDGLKTKIPENYLIMLYGEPGCGKSYLIHLIDTLKQMDLKEITEGDREFLGFDSKDYTADVVIREIKEMVDSISIIAKKTTRPARDSKKSNPEIQEGMSLEEVQKCEWTYEHSGNLYGIEKQEVDDALECGDAIVIVNDPTMETVNNLNKTYPDNLLPVLVHNTAIKEKWIEEMKSGGRTDEEILKRSQKFGQSIKNYGKVFSDVILNIDGKIANKDLLLQLKAVMQRKDRDIDWGMEKERENS